MKYTINELANSKGVSQLVREALLQMEAELEATNRQVEILSDALAESRREVAALKAVARGKPTDEMVQAATDEYDEWAVDNKGTTECIRAMLVKALKATPPAQPAPAPVQVLQRYSPDRAGAQTATWNAAAIRARGETK